MDKVTQFTKITHSPHFGMHQIFFYENNNGTLISVCFSDIFWAQLFLSTLSIYQFKNLSVFCALFLFNANHFENSKYSKEQVVIAVSCWNGIIKILNTNEI